MTNTFGMPTMPEISVVTSPTLSAPVDADGQTDLIVPVHRRQTRRVNLCGQVYLFRDVKAWFAMRVAKAAKAAGDDPDAMLAAIGGWIEQGFGADRGRDIVARLDDQNDDLDVSDLMKLMEMTMATPQGPTG